MARISFGSKAGRVRASSAKTPQKPAKTPEEALREIRESQQKLPGEDYREQSLAIHGLICARCGREFDYAHRHLLTVHHKDMNHHNNPPDGSNWENLCVYCHEDTHSRGVLGEYVQGARPDEDALVYQDKGPSAEAAAPSGGLAAALERALKEKEKKRRV